MALIFFCHNTCFSVSSEKPYSPNSASSTLFMAADEVLDLYDFCWFVTGVFSSKTLVRPCIEEFSPVKVEEMMEDPLKVSPLQTLHTRSRSHDFLSSKTTENLTADQIPNSLKLQTIFSSKEVGDKELPENTAAKVKEISRRGRVKEERRRKVVARGSKSLSELEFMELKGFMDLGFVFSEEEYENSNLVSIIPALQRLGKRKEEEGSKEEKGSVVSRPYLSEAWEAMDECMKKRVLMNWRVPVLGTAEIAMKDHLKFWAQTVASTVR